MVNIDYCLNMQNPETFLIGLEKNERTIAEILHGEINSIPGVSCKIRFGIPFYDYKKWLCYLSPQKKGGIELCFIQGLKLDPEGVYLDAKNRKQVAGITFREAREIDQTLVRALVLEAINFENSINQKKTASKHKQIKIKS